MRRTSRFFAAGRWLAHPLLSLCAALLAVLSLTILPGCWKKKDGTAAYCALSVETTPTGASVRINGRDFGSTPLNLKIPKSQYLIELSKANHKTVWRSIPCFDASHKLEIELPPVTASVLIESDPPKAAIFIDGNQVGETPLIRHNLKIGEYSASLRKPGCSVKEINWTVKDARPQIASAKLEPNTGTLSITSSPAKATLSINGTPRGTTPFQGELEQGEYKIKLETPGYGSCEDTLIVNRGGKTSKEYKMSILPGGVKITVDPPQAQLILVGPGKKERPLGGSPAIVDQLEPGDYEVRAELPPNYDSDTKQFTIIPGKNIELSIKLEGNTGQIEIIANPPGVTVYVDGKKIGVSEPGDDKFSSKKLSVRGLSSGVHEIMLTHKNGSPSKITEKVNVKKNRITRPDPITMWVKDTFIKLKNGRVVVGKLVRKNPNEVHLQIEPSVTQGFNVKEIVEMRALDTDE